MLEARGAPGAAGLTAGVEIETTARFVTCTVGGGGTLCTGAETTVEGLALPFFLLCPLPDTRVQPSRVTGKALESTAAVACGGADFSA
jgi:hypothetical protein